MIEFREHPPVELVMAEVITPVNMRTWLMAVRKRVNDTTDPGLKYLTNVCFNWIRFFLWENKPKWMHDWSYCVDQDALNYYPAPGKGCVIVPSPFWLGCFSGWSTIPYNKSGMDYHKRDPWWMDRTPAEAIAWLDLCMEMLGDRDINTGAARSDDGLGRSVDTLRPA